MVSRILPLSGSGRKRASAEPDPEPRLGANVLVDTCRREED